MMGALPAPYTMGTGSLPGVKLPGRGVENLPSLASSLKKGYGYNSTPLWVFVTCFVVNFTFTLTFIYIYIYIYIYMKICIDIKLKIKKVCGNVKC
jgi:hypothetical protein